MIRLVKNTFHNEQEVKKQLVSFIQDADRLSFGPECEKFEHNFSAYQERKHSVFVNSGSSANLALIQALLNSGRLSKGDAVGFSALTWATNVMPIIQLGLVPIPVDVELDTLNMSSRNLKAVMTKFPLRALFITNLLGFCDDIDEIERLCKESGIILLEDNCEALGTVYKGRKLGNWGLASTFSFFVGHHFSTIEGGMICTDDEELANELRLVRAHGWDRNLGTKEQDRLRQAAGVDDFYARYSFYELGYNLRPTEINGFLGNAQVKYIDDINIKRKENFLRFADAIYSKTEKYHPLRYDHIDFVSNFAVPVVCNTVEIRDELLKECDGKVEVRPIVGGDMTAQPFFKKYVSGDVTENENASLIHKQGLYFGNNQDLTTEEINEIIEIFN